MTAYVLSGLHLKLQFWRFKLLKPYHYHEITANINTKQLFIT